MKSFASISKNKVIPIENALMFVAGIAGIVSFNQPVFAHHPMDARAPETFNLIEGFISGLAHPIIGIDHFLFLFSIGLLATLSFRRWVPLLLVAGMLGTLLSMILPNFILQIEIFTGASLIFASLALLERVTPYLMLPLIMLHGYVLGQSILGAEPTPLITYFLGLLLSEIFIILLGTLMIDYFKKSKLIFSGILSVAGGLCTYFAVSGMI